MYIACNPSSLLLISPEKSLSVNLYCAVLSTTCGHWGSRFNQPSDFSLRSIIAAQWPLRKNTFLSRELTGHVLTLWLADFVGHFVRCCTFAGSIWPLLWLTAVKHKSLVEFRSSECTCYQKAQYIKNFSLIYLQGYNPGINIIETFFSPCS